ncbi:hypothetical protein Tco_0828250 [Tanacetum coccineum]
MAPLPHRDLTHPWLGYQVEGYDEGIIHNYEHRLETIFRKEVNHVHVLDFAGLTDGMRQTLADRLSMVYTRDDREALMSDTEMVLDEEIAEVGFGAYWSGSERVILDKGDLRDYWMKISSDRDFLGPAPSYVHIRDPMRRLYHMMIACSISGRGQGAEKVTRVDLFYLRTMDHETTNVPYLLAQYLFRQAKGRKSGARLSKGHFIGRLAAHFGLVVQGLERQHASALGAAEDAPVIDEGAEAILAPVQAPQLPPPAPQHRTMS